MSYINRLLLLAGITLMISGCASVLPNKNPTGTQFPKVLGTALTKETKQLPASFAGQHTILLIGYVQNAQFDIDRWLIGLDMVGSTIPVYEIPTINGMFPQIFSTQIDNGMRKGIPKPLWKGVITVYDDAEQIVQLTGNTNSNNARVMMLNPAGTITYFNDEGFSVDGLKALLAASTSDQ